MLSICTLGLIDFRSDKERTARYARHTRNAVRAQAPLLAPPVPPVHPPTIPAGWYPCGPGVERWFDGYQWTPTARPVSRG